MQNVVAVMFDYTYVGSPAAILRRSPGVYAGFKKGIPPHEEVLMGIPLLGIFRTTAKIKS